MVKVGLIVIVFVVLVGVIFGLSKLPEPDLHPLKTQYVEGVFADLNGDGMVDFIVSAEVVLQTVRPLQLTPLPNP